MTFPKSITLFSGQYIEAYAALYEKSIQDGFTNYYTPEEVGTKEHLLRALSRGLCCVEDRNGTFSIDIAALFSEVPNLSLPRAAVRRILKDYGYDPYNALHFFVSVIGSLPRKWRGYAFTGEVNRRGIPLAEAYLYLMGFIQIGVVELCFAKDGYYFIVKEDED